MTKSDLYERFFDYYSSPAAILDYDYNFICVNQHYALIYNQNPEDFIDCNYFDKFAFPGRSVFRRVVKTKESYRARSCPFIHGEKSMTYWDWTLTPLVNDHGSVEFLLVILQEITKEHQAELDHLFSLCQELFSIIDLNTGCFLWVNDAFTRFLGYEFQEVLNEPFWQWVHPEEQGPILMEYQKMIQGGMGNCMTLRFRCKDQTYRYLRCTWIPVVDEDRIYAVAQDVTDEAMLQCEFLRIEHLSLLGKMAASIAHEIKNPITTVRAMLQALSLTADCQRCHNNLEILTKELDRATRMISRFLALARDKPINKQRQDLNELIGELEPLLQACAQELGMNVHFDLQPLPPVLVDSEEITQLVLNLVRNGLEAMALGGTLTIKTRWERANVILTIVDEGSGISGETLAEMYKPFFSTKEQGTGLGIPVCQSIVQRHDAHWQIETSEAGTRVIVAFPPEIQRT